MAGNRRLQKSAHLLLLGLLRAQLDRIINEYSELQSSPIEGASVELVSDSSLNKWQGVLHGPAASPYAGGKFKFTLEFPLEYPFKAPQLKILTKIYHPNVNEDGNICLGLLKSEAWKPSTKVGDVLRAVLQLLAEPNPDDPLMVKIAEQYNSNRPRFDYIAADWVSKHAR